MKTRDIRVGGFLRYGNLIGEVVEWPWGSDSDHLCFCKIRMLDGEIHNVNTANLNPLTEEEYKTAELMFE